MRPEAHSCKTLIPDARAAHKLSDIENRTQEHEIYVRNMVNGPHFT